MAKPRKREVDDPKVRAGKNAIKYDDLQNYYCNFEKDLQKSPNLEL